jgi:uronate dehydrogenase
MKVVLVGAAGHTSHVCRPKPCEHHQRRVVDAHPPGQTHVEYIARSETIPDDALSPIDRQFACQTPLHRNLLDGPPSMKVLLIGGAGHVGTFVTPYLLQHHQLRVLDPLPPGHADVEYIRGSVTNPDDVRRALDGTDTFINMVMKSPQGGSVTDQTVTEIAENYEVNTLGLHVLLWTAQSMGIMRGVHTSTMSVHYRERPFFDAEELVPYDTPSVYGLTKGFGEQICQYFARWFGMNLIALRITGPRTREQFQHERSSVTPGERHLYWTDEEDLARAYLAALEAVQVGHGRFDAIFIAGDEDEHEHNLSKAKRLLDWHPTSQRYLSS